MECFYQSLIEEKESKKLEQILQSTYLNDPDKWQTEANRLDGLEICDDDTGEPMYILEPHRIRH